MKRPRARTPVEGNEAGNTCALSHDARTETYLVTFDPVQHLGHDPTERWTQRYPDRGARRAAVEAVIHEALQAPIQPSGLYSQMIGGRGEGMRLIRQLVAKNPSASYFAFPASDPETIAIVGEGRYFKPIYSTDPLVLCQCLPLRAETRGKLPPLNGLVRRLREHGSLR